MKISIYTFARNAVHFDFHIVDMLKHHLEFADEIIVNEGYSTDSTYEKIKSLDSRIKIYRNPWDMTDPKAWLMRFKNQARKLCTGDWCILLDADEFIPEWEFDNIRSFLEKTNKVIIPLRYINFYGNYKVFNKDPKKHNWPEYKYTLHRNIPNLEVWGDGSNVAFKSENGQLIFKDSRLYSEDSFICHHFGYVRNPARLREKWRMQASTYRKKTRLFIPKFLFDLFPHKWLDKNFLEDLSIYHGPYLKAVRENPQEFIRDDFKLYNHLLISANRV